MSDGVNGLASEIGEIVRRVGKRSEILDEVAENISFSDVIGKLMQEPGPVRDAARKIVLDFLKGYEIDSESEEAAEILENVNFKAIATELSKDGSVRTTLTEAIIKVVESANDNEQFTEAVDEAFGLNDSNVLKKIVEKLDDENRATINNAIVEKVKECFENLDTNNLSDETYETIESVLLSEANLRACLENNRDDLDEVVVNFIKNLLENADKSDLENHPIGSIILKSKALQDAVETSIKNLIASGKITKLVEDATTAMVNGKDSSFRDQISNLISEKLLGRIAESVVTNLLRR